MSRYRWLLFDADGTLFDYDRAESTALRAAWLEVGLEPHPHLVDAYRRINGELWQVYEVGGIGQVELRVERFARLARSLERPAEPAELSQVYLRHLSRQAALIEGALELLDWLRGGFELALITNGIPDVQRPRIRLSGLEKLFPVVVISGEVGAAKPAPAIFDEAFRRMGHPRREAVLMVGDSLSSDIQGGADYGLDTCWYNPHGRPLAEEGPEPRFEIRKLGELRQILGSASSS